MSIDLEIVDEGIARITLNRPERHNAFDEEHYRDLSLAWARVRDEDAIRVAIVTGAGEKSFSSGADLKSFFGKKTAAEMWLTQKDQLLNRGLEVWKPIVAAVNGYCLGGGMTLLMATDIRIAADHATFALSEVKRGIVAGNGGTQRILDQLPRAIAMEVLLTGDRFDAATAERWGFVNKVVPLPRLQDEALQYARRLSVNAPLALQASKELALRSREMSLAEGFRMEQFVNRMLQGTADAKEGAAAFSEKRAPRFTAS